MPLRMGSLYDALLLAHVPEAEAKAAAEEVADYDGRIAHIEGDLNLLKWMVSTNIALTTAVLFKLFFT